MNIGKEMSAMQREIEGYAREFGLDFFTTIFELCTSEQINEIAAYGGFPIRYPHWRFGMEYENLKKGYTYGLSKIYEMVINTDPCYAYLMECNSMLDQKLVMAHVCGHCDFFKNNFYFQHTNRKMLDEVANHATVIRRYMERFGQEQVEDFIDVCLSLEDLIDIHSPYIKRFRPLEPIAEDGGNGDSEIQRLRSKPYMEEYINPREFIEEQRKLLAEKRQKKARFPQDPKRDILGFLLVHAPLKPWQQEILSIIREEAYYFSPQGQTKIMNEGWATYWHSRIMTERALKDSEVIDFADHHSGTVAMSPGRLNPYKLGLELFRYIEDCWNKGKFGKEFDECTDMDAKKRWDKKLGLGREKIFEVRKIYNDVTFIDTFLTEEFINDQMYYSYRYNKAANEYQIDSREFEKVKKKLLFSLTNFGRPILQIEDANFENRGELLVVHHHEEIDMDMGKGRYALENLQKLWGRPVHLETVLDKKTKRFTHDGTGCKEKSL